MDVVGVIARQNASSEGGGGEVRDLAPRAQRPRFNSRTRPPGFTPPDALSSLGYFGTGATSDPTERYLLILGPVESSPLPARMLG